MGERIKVAFAGLGNRGKDTYAHAAELYPDKMEVVAVADWNPIKVKMVAEKFNIPEEMCFGSVEEMLERVE